MPPFQLNTNAKQLKQQHSNSILVLVKGNSNQLFGTLVEKLQADMAGREEELAVDYLDEDHNEVRRALQLCLEKKPRGILFLGGNRENFLADFDKICIPCVLVTDDASGMPFDNLSSVSSDDRMAAYLAILALTDRGHRKFAIIGGDRQVSDTTKLRYQGCLDAFAACAIGFDKERDYEYARFSYEGGYRAVCNLLDRDCDFTALFAMSDVMAIGAIRALRDRGLRVPEDVSVMGFDGLPISRFTTPRLSTVCQDSQALAERSLQLLLDAIAAPGKPCYEMVPVHVEVRESVNNVSENSGSSY